jgi:hypothetical protein
MQGTGTKCTDILRSNNICCYQLIRLAYDPVSMALDRTNTQLPAACST